MKRSVLALAMGLIAITAMAKTIKTTVFTTSPQMHCENCENKIKGNLRFEKGVKKIVTDIDSQTVTVTYDADKTSVDRLMKRIHQIRIHCPRAEARRDGHYRL